MVMNSTAIFLVSCLLLFPAVVARRDVFAADSCTATASTPSALIALAASLEDGATLCISPKTAYLLHEPLIVKKDITLKTAGDVPHEDAGVISFANFFPLVQGGSSTKEGCIVFNKTAPHKDSKPEPVHFTIENLVIEDCAIAAVVANNFYAQSGALNSTMDNLVAALSSSVTIHSLTCFNFTMGMVATGFGTVLVEDSSFITANDWEQLADIGIGALSLTFADTGLFDFLEVEPFSSNISAALRALQGEVLWTIRSSYFLSNLEKKGILGQAILLSHDIPSSDAAYPAASYVINALQFKIAIEACSFYGWNTLVGSQGGDKTVPGAAVLILVRPVLQQPLQYMIADMWGYDMQVVGCSFSSISAFEGAALTIAFAAGGSNVMVSVNASTFVDCMAIAGGGGGAINIAWIQPGYIQSSTGINVNVEIWDSSFIECFNQEEQGGAISVLLTQGFRDDLPPKFGDSYFITVYNSSFNGCLSGGGYGGGAASLAMTRSFGGQIFFGSNFFNRTISIGPLESSKLIAGGAVTIVYEEAFATESLIVVNNYFAFSSALRRSGGSCLFVTTVKSLAEKYMLTFLGNYFYKAYSLQQGGAVFLNFRDTSPASALFEGNIFIQCVSSEDQGGGISVLHYGNATRPASLKVVHNIFRACIAKEGGAGFAVTMLSQALDQVIVSTNNSFVACTTPFAGGAIIVYFAELDAAGGNNVYEFVGNTYSGCYCYDETALGGGAIAMIVSVVLPVAGTGGFVSLSISLEDESFYSCHAAALGGGALLLLVSNPAGETIGAVPLAIMSFTRVFADENYVNATGYGGGGAVSINEARVDLTITDCTFVNNYVLSSGDGAALSVVFTPGAVAAYDANLTDPHFYSRVSIYNSVIQNNSIVDAGGALALDLYGGSVYLSGASLDMRDALFVNNSCFGLANDVVILTAPVEFSALNCSFYLAPEQVASASMETPLPVVRSLYVDNIGSVPSDAGNIYICPAGYNFVSNNFLFRGIALDALYSGCLRGELSILQCLRSKYSAVVQCEACSEGQFSVVKGVNDAFVSISLSSRRLAQNGSLYSPSFSCLPCSRGTVCTGGADMAVRPGYWVDDVGLQYLASTWSPENNSLTSSSYSASSSIYGYPIDTLSNPMSLVVFLCPEGYCCNPLSDQASSSPETASGGMFQTQTCTVYSSGVRNSVCAGNRQGRLCGSCQPGYTFTKGTSECIPSEKCAGGSLSIPIILVLSTGYVAINLLRKNSARTGEIKVITYFFNMAEILSVNFLWEKEGESDAVTAFQAIRCAFFTSINAQVSRTCYVAASSNSTDAGSSIEDFLVENLCVIPNISSVGQLVLDYAVPGMLMTELVLISLIIRGIRPTIQLFHVIKSRCRKALKKPRESPKELLMPSTTVSASNRKSGIPKGHASSPPLYSNKGLFSPHEKNIKINSSRRSLRSLTVGSRLEMDDPPAVVKRESESPYLVEPIGKFDGQRRLAVRLFSTLITILVITYTTILKTSLSLFTCRSMATLNDDRQPEVREFLFLAGDVECWKYKWQYIVSALVFPLALLAPMILLGAQSYKRRGFAFAILRRNCRGKQRWKQEVLSSATKRAGDDNEDCESLATNVAKEEPIRHSFSRKRIALLPATAEADCALHSPYHELGNGDAASDRFSVMSSVRRRVSEPLPFAYHHRQRSKRTQSYSTTAFNEDQRPDLIETQEGSRPAFFIALDILESSFIPNRWWWETFMLYRRVLLIATFAFVDDVLVRAYVQVLWCLCIIILTAVFRPFRFPHMQTLELLSLSLLTGMAVFQIHAATLYGGGLPSNTATKAQSTVIATINLSFVLIMCLVTLCSFLYGLVFYLRRACARVKEKKDKKNLSMKNSL